MAERKSATKQNTAKSTGKARSTAASRSSGSHAASPQNTPAGQRAHRPERSSNPGEQAGSRSTGLVDADARRQMAGIVIAVVGIACLVAVLVPSTGVVTGAVSDALHAVFGIGSVIVPLVLIAWAVTFFVGGRRLMPGRVAAGLALIALAIIGLVGITTPSIEVSDSILFNSYVLHDRGGFVGNGLAWVLLTLFGKVAGIVILAGMVAGGLVLVGLNFKDALLDARSRHTARTDARRAQEERRARVSGGYDGRGIRGDLPRDYAPTALFDPDHPLTGSLERYGSQQAASMRPVTGNLYPDGSFVPLDNQDATSYLAPGSIPTTVLQPRGRTASSGSFGCGNTPRASSSLFERADAPASTDFARSDFPTDVDQSAGSAPYDAPFEDADSAPSGQAAVPGFSEGPAESTMMNGASALAAKRAARKAESASRWWNPADERRRADYDPDALRLYPDHTLPGVLPGAPTSFDDLQDGFERMVEENLETDPLDPLDPPELVLESPVPAFLDVHATGSASATSRGARQAESSAKAGNGRTESAPGDMDDAAAVSQHIPVSSGHAIAYVESPDLPEAGIRSTAQPELPWEDPRQSSVDAASSRQPFRLPDASVLQRGKRGLKKSPEQERETQEMAVLLQNTLQEFGVKAEVVDWVDGPTFTTYEVNPGEGVRVNKFTSLEDDIARALAQQSVRIYAPVPGTRYVGIEVPNKTKQTVYFGDVLPAVTGGPLDFAIGLDANGKPVHADLAKLPHILIAGTTGSGKSVTVNTIVVSMLMRDTPDDVRLIMIDPKQVEFSGYNGIPHLIMPVVTDMKQAAAALQWGVTEMDRRYRLFSNVGVRELKSYNAQVDSGAFAQAEFPLQHLPSIVIVIDELADLMMVAKKDVEASIVRIAQLGRACGIHLVMATQRPSADVVTGLIRANVANRIGLKVAKGTDSKVVIDQTGAEKLLGNGDMLFLQTSFGDKPRRIQGCWLSDDEISAVVEQLKSQQCDDYAYQMAPLPGARPAGSPLDGPETVGAGAVGGSGDEDEPLAWQAAQLVVENQLGSTSMVQRRLKLGYARAGRIMDMLEEMGVVGPARGSKPRDVLIRDLDELETLRGATSREEGGY